MQTIVGVIVTKVLEFFYGKISAAIAKWYAYREARAAANKKNQQVTEQTMAAQTEKERDEAAQNAINKF